MKTDLEANQALLGPGMLRSAPGGPGQMAEQRPSIKPLPRYPTLQGDPLYPGRHTEGHLQFWL